MIKIISSFLLIAVTGGFVINQVPSWKQKVVEVVNPASKEARLLGELKANLNELDDALNSSDGKSNNSNDLISKSKNLVDEIATTNQKNSGIIRQQVGKIIDAFLDKTPFPADHLQTDATSVSPLVCPPIK
ncbi:MAG: hypothetical protein A2831_02725 [Candidatus Yanofskybacteria bacterium RIFCSPHIGHO2_01_FULL_44_17]|uniref:Uncharacterized protein n=1 Tax=Candidatus Yanofskybacteria bacterium RIFCSPHIGHO2_01_FULL_44_17 TaxID=1802668 RepID=A0A1F8EWM4_9BACT|nr:MAG: hypothetical protein A2831_02725 [Candidatus Yanofskybacteria bacterium RIFCSPHIGHO2_01_FULL_44_17]